MSQVVSSAFFGLQTAALIEYIDKLTKEEELYIYNKTQMLYIIS